MRVLHLVDDEKFIDVAIEEFENEQLVQNIYLLGHNDKNDSFKPVYVKSNKVEVCRYGSQEYDKYVFGNGNYDLVVVHFLSFEKSLIVNKLQLNTMVLWLMWGADFYNTHLYKGKLYESITLQLFKQMTKQPFSTKGIKFLKKNIKNIVGKKSLETEYEKAIKRVDFCATVIPTEFEILCKVKGFKAKKVFFNYGSIGELVKNQIMCISDRANSILIGNSNTFESNHLDAFNLVKQAGFPFEKLIVPMNYGGGGIDYRNHVSACGKRLFGDKINILLGFIPIDDYVQLLETCKVAIFYHNRQQAVGNIIIMLYLGSRVYLSNNNPVYKYYKQIGLNVFSIEDEFSILKDKPMTDIQIAHNRYILENEYSSETICKNVKNLITSIRESL